MVKKYEYWVITSGTKSVLESRITEYFAPKRACKGTNLIFLSSVWRIVTNVNKSSEYCQFTSATRRYSVVWPAVVLEDIVKPCRQYKKLW